VSKSSDIAATPRSPLRSLRFSRDWITRPVFGVALALITVAAIYGGALYLALVVAAAAFFGAREWHRIIDEGKLSPELAPTTAAIWLALGALILWPSGIASYAVLLCGMFLVLALSATRRTRPLWQAAGVLYIGLPSLALVLLREIPARGGWLIGLLFVVVWATDTSAFVIGKLVGGPKLAPVLSPNKTWSGIIGGVATAAAASAVFITLIGGDPARAALFGAALSVVAHLGDLFESWVKRRFHLKNSGALIPGHGGVLDRIDSTLAAALAMQIAVFLFGLDPLFGARP